MSTVSVFEKITQPKNPKYANVDVILNSIKAGGKISPLISRIRAATTKSERDELKKLLPVIVFSGKFRERRAEAIIEYSRILTLDFDGLEAPWDFRDELAKNPYIFAAFLSPTGTGVKALVKVSSENHLSHALALLQDFPEADANGVKDLPRACFMSEDKDIYINQASQIYTGLKLPKYTDEQKYDNLKKWLENKGSKFKTGERNSFIVKLSSAANRFGVSKDFLKSKIEEEFINGSDFTKREMESTVDGIYDRYGDQFNTVDADEIWTDSKINDVLSGEIKSTDIIYLNSVREDIKNDYINGVHKGPTTYFPTVDEIFRRVPGQLNVLTGHGNQGKSSWQQQLDIVDSAITGGKFGYFGPEAYPPKKWYRQLIQTIVGKSMSPMANNRMTSAELDLAMDFINERFHYIYPPKLPSPEYIIDRFMESIIKHGLKGVTVDPFNQLVHSMTKRDDVYLAETLSLFERFAQQQQVLLTIITHPNRTTKGSDGNYAAPDVYDLNGGPVWNARASNICTYNRPNYSTNPADTTCELIFRKIKDQDLCGIPGTVTLQYDRNSSRFYDNGYNPLTKFKL